MNTHLKLCSAVLWTEAIGPKETTENMNDKFKIRYNSRACDCLAMLVFLHL